MSKKRSANHYMAFKHTVGQQGTQPICNITGQIVLITHSTLLSVYFHLGALEVKYTFLWTSVIPLFFIRPASAV